MLTYIIDRVSTFLCPSFVEMSTDSGTDLVSAVKQSKLPHSMFAQNGSLNCVLLAARFGHTELFHYLVQTYHCNPRQKDRQTGVREKGSLCATYVCVPGMYNYI